METKKIRVIAKYLDALADELDAIDRVCKSKVPVEFGGKEIPCRVYLKPNERSNELIELIEKELSKQINRGLGR